MKERPETDKPVKADDIRSSDIENAHASGDGAMGRNDEKLDDAEHVKDAKQPPAKNEPSVY